MCFHRVLHISKEFQNAAWENAHPPQQVWLEMRPAYLHREQGIFPGTIGFQFGQEIICKAAICIAYSFQIIIGFLPKVILMFDQGIYLYSIGILYQIFHVAFS